MYLIYRISILREKLNKAIKNQEDYEIIYKLSVGLDQLIVEYYKLYENNG